MVAALVALGPVALAGADTTTTSEPVTTTTVAPTTSTPPTTAPTTTSLPVTTTSRGPVKPTTTTSTATTTTTTHSSSSSTWVFVLAALAGLALVIAIIAGIVAMSRRKKAGEVWLPSARSAYESAVLARSLLVSQPTGGDAQLPKVRAQAEDAARTLDKVAASAPETAGQQATAAAAAGLRGVMFSLEAESLLRSGSTPPTPDQLAEADVARRRRGAELDTALNQLDVMTRPPAR
jgi:hypothetical protein